MKISPSDSHPTPTAMRTAESWLRYWNADEGLTIDGGTLLDFIHSVQQDAIKSVEASRGDK